MIVNNNNNNNNNSTNSNSNSNSSSNWLASLGKDVHRYLLRTESIEPLVAQVLKLLLETEANLTRLSEICRFLDSELKFPSVISLTKTSLLPNSDLTDPFLRLLEQKYGYQEEVTADQTIWSKVDANPDTDSKTNADQEIPVHDRHIYTTDDIERQVAFLQNLVRSRIAKNKQLLHLILDHESALHSVVLPEVRRSLLTNLKKDITAELVEKKLRHESKVFEAYTKRCSQNLQLET